MHSFCIPVLFVDLYKLSVYIGWQGEGGGGATLSKLL